MVITYQGDNYFKIQSGNFTILIDPSNGRSLKGSNIVINTIKPSTVPREEGDSDYVWIENQGEYEINGVRLDGWSAGQENSLEKTLYVFELEDIRVAVLGQITKEPPPELLEHLEEVDIAIMPCVKPYLNETDAAKIIRQIEPGLIIPSFVNDIPKKLFSELGQSPSSEEKLVIKKKDISPAAMKIICLSSK